MRAAWLSTVRNIDWPTSAFNTTEKNISDLIRIIDYLKDANLNTVIMQVRPASDAMYASTIEPWSSWLTGTQGKAPSPFYDPLQIAIEESHKRGMELHAWLNPYRVRLASYNLNLDEMNVAVQHPDWVLNINGDEILDPGIPEVRQHIVNVITDIITRYDVDAIHFDDYFYLEGITNQDAQTFATYPNGFTNLGDWRRNNVNELLRMIYAQIQAVNPRVKFGQSPPGIWKSGVPEGTFGWNVYSSIYCDAVTWFNEQIIDYLAPQLYWAFGGGQDYGKLAPWWASVSNDRHVYPGLAYYRVGETTFDKTQIGKMVSYNRTNNDIQGEVYFTANNFAENRSGVTDTLKNNYYKYPALVPVMDWKDTISPNNPDNLRFDRVSGIGTTAITWNVPVGEDIKFYALYRSLDANFLPSNISDPKNIFKITSNNYVQIDEQFPTEKAYYYVTALDWNNNESSVSNIFEYEPVIVLPDVPNLVSPANSLDNVKDTVNFVWNYANNANSYSLKIATDSEFSNLVFSKTDILDTTYQVTGLSGETEYFWSVKAVNLAGDGNYATGFNFVTGYPIAPTLISPTFQQLNVDLNPTFKWQNNPIVSSYHIQIAEGLGIVNEYLVLDTILTDTSVQLSNLKPGTFYAWRVNAINEFGTSLWSKLFQLKTVVIIPDIPTLVSPADDLNTLGETISFVWNKANYSNTYKIQVSKVESFSSRVFEADNLIDTTITFSGFEGATNYYWRVRANNNGGSSAFSQAFSFLTGFPLMPTLLYPAYQAINKEIDPILRWTKSNLATEYNVQLSSGLSIDVNKLVIDSIVADTVLYYKKLNPNTIYSWRVKAKNSSGESNWTSIFQFKTSTDTVLAVEEPKTNLPKEYSLEQNYPNPFNPSTTISFALPKAGMTKLTVYNIIGQQVATLVSEYLDAGVYKIQFNANSYNKGLTSGLYLYRLESSNFVYIKKMILLK